MQIWVGLGNPGPDYAMQRHNVGFMAADVIAEMHGFGPVQRKFSGWVQEGRIGGHKVLLLKPATFMNESGRSVAEALRFYKLGTDALTVLHDELDLAPFKEIGSASCRERVCQYVSISVVAVSLQTKTTINTIARH